MHPHVIGIKQRFDENSQVSKRTDTFDILANMLGVPGINDLFINHKIFVFAKNYVILT